ncbi:MAG: aminotransferase class I/II-fold pyridoxal phosphate-dependent enzyme [Actinomycetia bacterium]|nr:aminotransferase class I/II-fold pyridoxal phosphate-dependent enzyme [Actinomycetes bacterium]
MKLNPVLASQGSYPIAIVRERAAERERAGLPVIDFSIGDPREPTPQFIVDALIASVPAISQYPTAPGRSDLREAIAGYVSRRFGVSVDPSTQIIPTSGSKEAIFSTALAFVEAGAGDGVVYPSPGYPVYERGAMFAGADLNRIVLDGDFIMRADDIPVDVWDNARLVWTCTPHNPSGAVASFDELSALYSRCRANDALLLSDECYADIYEADEYPGGPASVLQVADEGINGALVYLSLSKRSGMTGYRSGAIVGDAAAIAALKSLRSTTGTASPDFIQGAAIAAWSDDGHAGDRSAVFTAKRRILESAFIDAGMEIVASTAGLYLWVRVGDDLAVSDMLLEHGIVVSPGRIFGSGGKGYIRLALVPTLDACTAAADALRDALVTSTQPHGERENL